LESSWNRLGAGAEFNYGDSISALSQDGNGVEVTFERSASRRYDLVIGADGQHSTVRRLAWGPETDSVAHRGLYVATLPVERELNPSTDVLLYGLPGRLASVHPVHGDGGIAAFIWRSQPVPGCDYRDTAQHKRIVERAYAGTGWIVPALIERVRDHRQTTSAPGSSWLRTPGTPLVAPSGTGHLSPGTAPCPGPAP
jgi:2-polyprenyl-6-methoxyphenol hydroxylase-like FAD-dependent oxidoreductase